jgi:hypothetical protein
LPSLTFCIIIVESQSAKRLPSASRGTLYEIIPRIYYNKDVFMTKSEGICDMCGHFVILRQKAHIIAEGKKDKNNLLMLCPSCHIIFDTHLKPKIFNALKNYGIKDFPISWEKSIYQ